MAFINRAVCSFAMISLLSSTVMLAPSADAAQKTKAKTKTSSTQRRGSYFVPPPPAYAPSILSSIRSRHVQQSVTVQSDLVASEDEAQAEHKSSYDTHIKTYGVAAPHTTQSNSHVTHVVSYNRS